MKEQAKPWGMALGVGAVLGALIYHAALWLAGMAVIDRDERGALQQLVASLREENRQLSDDLFAAPENRFPLFDAADFPYDEDADAAAEVVAARAAAARDGKFLMVTFGANWCVDCRTLYKNLGSEEVAAYTQDRFMFVNVNVGKFNHNTDVAAELGVSLERGIPVAIFYDDEGNVIGTTNAGELEPARLYTSKQILKFVRDIAERSRVLAPDAVL